MLTRLADADQESCGGKAAMLGVLLRAGLSVPDGFVIPEAAPVGGMKITRSIRTEVTAELARLGDPVVAVRSSAMSEDTAEASAAGQYESVIGVRGAASVCDAIVSCWSSVHAPRVGHYWSRAQPTATPPAPGMAVLVQRMIAAEASGVMFTPQQAGDPTRIEASWGLGLSVVGGTVTPDTYEVRPDGSIAHAVGSKKTRIDLDAERGGLTTRTVDADQQGRALDDRIVKTLTELGSRIAEILCGPQDIEWAVADDAVWVLQARPITARVPATRISTPPRSPQALQGTPGAHGVVTGGARIVRGHSDFQAVQPGDIVICPYTDPAWTPLFRIAAGVVTETGGALSHAAIVAREYGIPAVLGVPDALNLIENGSQVTLDGTAGTITPL